MTSEKLSVVEWVKTNLSKFANENVAIEMCVDELKKSRKTVRDAITRYKLTAASLLSELKSNKIKKTNKPSTGLSIDDIRGRCDIIYKIEKAIEQIPQNRFIPDSEFREVLVKCSTTQYRSKADLDKFLKNKGSAKGVTYWGSDSDIKRLKDEGILK